MSETYHYKGKIKSTNLTVLEFINFKSKEDGVDLESWAEDDPIEWFYFCDYNKNYIIMNNLVYEFIEQKKDDDLHFCTVRANQDGTIDYEAVFHNGGTDLSEVLEQAFKALPVPVLTAPQADGLGTLYRISCVDVEHARGVLARLAAEDFAMIQNPCIFGKDVLYKCETVLDSFKAYQTTKELSGDDSYRSPGSDLSSDEIEFYLKQRGNKNV